MNLRPFAAMVVSGHARLRAFDASTAVCQVTSRTIGLVVAPLVAISPSSWVTTTSARAGAVPASGRAAFRDDRDRTDVTPSRVPAALRSHLERHDALVMRAVKSDAPVR